MKIKLMRRISLCLILATLCAGILFQYITAEGNDLTNAVMVMAMSR